MPQQRDSIIATAHEWLRSSIKPFWCATDRSVQCSPGQLTALRWQVQGFRCRRIGSREKLGFIFGDGSLNATVADEPQHSRENVDDLGDPLKP